MYIPHTKVKDFVNTVQRDPKLNEILHPYQNEDQAQELVAIYEPNAMFGQKGEVVFLEGQGVFPGETVHPGSCSRHFLQSISLKFPCFVKQIGIIDTFRF